MKDDNPNAWLESAVKLSNDCYAAGFKEGHKQGYLEGHRVAIDAALRIMDTTFKKPAKPESRAVVVQGETPCSS